MTKPISELKHSLTIKICDIPLKTQSIQMGAWRWKTKWGMWKWIWLKL